MKKLIQAYKWLIVSGNWLQSPLLLLCRLYWGWLFLMAGLGKLQDIPRTLESFQSLNLYAPHFLAYLVGLTEFLGGVCLMLGFASRLVAIPLAFTMVMAYVTAHSESLRNILVSPSVFVADSPFNFLLVSLLIWAFGPGKFSIDYWLEKTVFRNISKT
jgi:putative oxidoreductase